jgi:hypothetical protein
MLLKSRLRFLYAALGLLPLLLPAPALSAYTVPADMHLSANEKLVLDTLDAGKTMVFAKSKPEAERTISTAFLAALLGGKFGPNFAKQLVYIENAFIVAADSGDRPGRLSLYGLVVEPTVSFNNCTFMGKVSFINTRFRKSIQIMNSTFKDGLEADFCHVEQDVFLDHDTFEGDVWFILARIEGNLLAHHILVRKDVEVIFTGLQVDKATSFIDDSFESTVFFRGIRFGMSLGFNRTQFARSVSISGEIKDDLLVSGTKFLQDVSFKDLQVGNAVTFGKADGLAVKFLGVADFTSIKAGYLHLDAPVFEKEAIFSNAKIGGTFRAKDTIFNKGVSLDSGVFENLEILASDHRGTDVGKPQNPSHIDDLNLSDTIVKHNLELTGLTIKDLKGESLHVQGQAILRNLSFLDEVDLRHAVFDTLKIIEPVWPAPRKGGGSPVWLDGLTYNTIIYTDRRDQVEASHAKLLQDLNTFQFNIENYVQLEKFARRTGNDDWADDIYIQGKRRELLPHWLLRVGGFLSYLTSWVGWFFAKVFNFLQVVITWLFWDFMAGYGRKPFRVLGVAVVILVIGAFVFDPMIIEGKRVIEGTERQEELKRNLDWAKDVMYKSRRAKLIIFWRWTFLKYFFGVMLPLSLDIFVPTHHPALVEHWNRYAIPNWIRVYYFLHRAMGMILVPIAAVAFFIHFHLSNP